MIEAFPRLPEPRWLRDIVDGRPTLPPEHWWAQRGHRSDDPTLPLRALLTDSLFYPSSGLDGTPIKQLGGNVLSFVYADYHVSPDELATDLLVTPRRGLRGYWPVLFRHVHPHELAPYGWQAPVRPGPESRGNGRLWYERPWVAHFALWSLWRRRPEWGPEHGPEHLSLLFVGGEATVTYQALYSRLAVAPHCVALIQPGDGFGGGWGCYGSGFFRRVLTANPAGLPELLIKGGYHTSWRVNESDWPESYPGGPCARFPPDAARHGSVFRVCESRRPPHPGATVRTAPTSPSRAVVGSREDGHA